jgi:hypothetical protein
VVQAQQAQEPDPARPKSGSTRPISFPIVQYPMSLTLAGFNRLWIQSIPVTYNHVAAAAKASLAF